MSLSEILFDVWNTLDAANESVKYLGITIDNELRYETYVNILATKLSRSIGVLSKLRLYSFFSFHCFTKQYSLTWLILICCMVYSSLG